MGSPGARVPGGVKGAGGGAGIAPVAPAKVGSGGIPSGGGPKAPSPAGR
jgi:hypothetical protein